MQQPPLPPRPDQQPGGFPQPGQPARFAPTGIPPETEFYSVALGPDYCGVWEKKTGILVARFDLTQEGWNKACAEGRRLQRKRQAARLRGFNVWIFINIVMALVVVPFVLLAVMVAVFTAMGRSIEQLGQTAAEGYVWLAGAAGYLLFVYVRPAKIGIPIGSVILAGGLLASTLVAINDTAPKPAVPPVPAVAKGTTAAPTPGEPASLPGAPIGNVPAPGTGFQPPTKAGTVISRFGFRIVLPAGWSAMGKPTKGFPYFGVANGPNCPGTALIIFRWDYGHPRTTSGAEAAAASMIGDGRIPGKVSSNEAITLPEGPARHVVSVRIENGRPVTYNDVVIPTGAEDYQLDLAGWVPGCAAAQPLELARTFRLVPGG